MALLSVARAIAIGTFIFARAATLSPAPTSRLNAEVMMKRWGIFSRNDDNPLFSSPVKPDIVGCSDDQASQIRVAWDDAGKLAAAHYRWVIPTWWSKAAYQDAADMYLGTDTRKDPGYIYDGPLRENVARQYALHFRGSSHAHSYAYATIFCDNPERPICEYHQVAASFNKPGALSNRHYVFLCPGFWRLSSLDTAIANGKLHPQFQYIIDKWVKTQAACLFHETYHWDETVSRPACNLVPERYKPKLVVDLASTNNTELAKLNAQSWTLAALATWLQQTFDLPTPPMPIEYVAPELQQSPAVKAWRLENELSLNVDKFMGNITTVGDLPEKLKKVDEIRKLIPK